MGEEERTVAFLGPKASYTHQAALKYSPTATLVPQISIEDVFAAVQSGSASRGVVPFENSTNGSVVFTLDLFADLKQRYPDIVVCAEVYVGVHHFLLGHAPTSLLDSSDAQSANLSSDDEQGLTVAGAQPLHDLKRVTKIYSHPQVWGQCKNFSPPHLRGVERQDVSSTSRAAELVAQDASGKTAAISSEMAGRACGLDVLARGIEDRKDNRTRFFVLRRASADSSPHYMGGEQQGGEDDVDDVKRFKTLISFTVPETTPGALADSLAVFKPYDLNLTSINARPSGIAPWNYVFFVEVTGKRLGGEKGAMNAALADLGQVSKGWRYLGSWERRD